MDQLGIYRVQQRGCDVFDLTPSNCPAFILAGGKSRRFGSDKSLFEIEGQPQVVRLGKALTDAGHSVTIVGGDSEKLSGLGFPFLTDQRPDSGPMMGVLSALLHQLEIGAAHCLFVTCDLAAWQPDWFLALLGNFEQPNSKLPFCFSGTGGPEPFPAIYHTDLAERLAAKIDGQQLSLRRLLASCGFNRAAISKDMPADWSFNTPDELQQVLKRMR